MFYRSSESPSPGLHLAMQSDLSPAGRGEVPHGLEAMSPGVRRDEVEILARNKSKASLRGALATKQSSLGVANWIASLRPAMTAEKEKPMPAILLIPPSAEPWSVVEAKAFLRVQHDDDDAVIAA